MASIAAIACNGVARLSTTGLRRVTSASAGVVNRRRGRSGQGRGHHCADARTICRSSLISAGRRSSMPAVAACALNGVSPTCRFICTSVGPSAQFAMVSRTRAPLVTPPIGQHATHGTSQPFGLGCVSPAAGEYGDIREFPRVRWLAHIRRGDCVSVPPARLSIVARLWPMPKACLADTDADRAESPMPNVGCVTTRKIRLVRGPTAAFRVDRLVATRAPSRL